MYDNLGFRDLELSYLMQEQSKVVREPNSLSFEEKRLVQARNARIEQLLDTMTNQPLGNSQGRSTTLGTSGSGEEQFVLYGQGREHAFSAKV